MRPVVVELSEGDGREARFVQEKDLELLDSRIIDCLDIDRYIRIFVNEEDIGFSERIGDVGFGRSATWEKHGGKETEDHEDGEGLFVFVHWIRRHGGLPSNADELI